MPVISEARLRDLCQQILLAMQTPPDLAEIVTDVLVKANIRGVDSHGCRLLKMYSDRIEKAGVIVPSARPEVLRQDGSAIFIDGHWGFGHVASRLAARQVVEIARQTGVATASIVNVHHIGRVGEYAEYIAEQGMLGIVICHANAATAPFGGMGRIAGSNPLAMAVPRSDGVLSSDFATSARSINKLTLYRQRGQELPDGIILDKEGYPSNDPEEYFDGGYLLPFGGYKGYAINLFIEVICGILVGQGCGALIHKHPGNGTLMIALDIAKWRSLDDFTSELDQYLAVVKETPPAPGFDEVLLPGELEIRAAGQRVHKGIPLDQETWDELQGLGNKLGLPASLFAK